MMYITLKKFGFWQLGNQIAQYIFLDYLRQLTGRKIVFFKNFPGDKDNLEYNKIRLSNIYKNIKIEFINYSDEYTFSDHIEKNFYDDEIVDNVIKDDKDVINLVGFFQSYKYYEKTEFDFKSRINLFILKEEYQTKINIEYKKIKNKSSNKLISIHVRRGDYLKYIDYHVLLPLTYYINCINKIEKKDTNFYYIICSDDIEWCKRVFFKISDRCFFSENSDVIDLYLMSLCNENVISNSSFSLISNYLNKEKKCYAPKIWFGKKHFNFKLDDIYEKDKFIMNS